MVVLPKIGTAIYCSNCKSFTVCKALPNTEMSMPKYQQWEHSDYNDIAGFRRSRSCFRCGHKFLTAEVDESFIHELVDLRNRFTNEQKLIVGILKRKTPWLNRTEKISLNFSEQFIMSTAWWLKHPSGPVRAPKHANRIYKPYGGDWAIDFGQNTFLVSKAIQRCRHEILKLFDLAADGQPPHESKVRNQLKIAVSSAVAKKNCNEYAAYYPIVGCDLIFGTQSIDVNDAADFIIKESGIDELFIRK